MGDLLNMGITSMPLYGVGGALKEERLLIGYEALRQIQRESFFKFVTLEAEENKALQPREKIHTEPKTSKLLLFAFCPASVWTFLI